MEVLEKQAEVPHMLFHVDAGHQNVVKVDEKEIKAHAHCVH